jgi:hypothetical protein
MELTSRDGIRFQLAVRRIYLELIIALSPTDRGPNNPELREILAEVNTFINTATDEYMQTRGKTMLDLLDKLASGLQRLLPLRTPIQQVAADFSHLSSERKSDLYSFGLEYGWLSERMNCSWLRIPPDLPRHARIGMGPHAGRVSIEEEFLVRDAYFMLASAEDALARLEELAERAEASTKAVPPQFYDSANQLNGSVGTYSRLSVVSFFAFVEAFVNSVGHDYLLAAQPNLTGQEQEILGGRKKGRYVSLEFKLEHFPKIIRPDKVTPIIISDDKQIKEPFKSFVTQVKDLRDSSVHFGPSKMAILRRPRDWRDQAQNACELCMEVARQFWRACYPGDALPRYLGQLDHLTHTRIAKERLQKTINPEFPSLNI